MNYLQLCQGIVSELGLSGGTGPQDVTGNTVIELNNVTRWIRDAALQIDNEWLDWKYLWRQYSASSVVSGTQSLAAPDPSPRLWDLRKMRVRPSGQAGQWRPMEYYTRQKLIDNFEPDNASPATPYAYTIQPDNSIYLAAPLDAAYDFKGEYWRRPLVLAAKADIPLIPEEHHRIIICRAAVMYGNREDAPEVISGMEAELLTMMDKLQSDQIEGFAGRRSGTDREAQRYADYDSGTRNWV